MKGNVDLTVTSGHFGRVFGGNNVGGTVSGSIRVNIEETGCHPITIGELYGCGNQAPYKAPAGTHPTINVKSFTSIGRIFGGGLGETAVVEGDPEVSIDEVPGRWADGYPTAGEWNWSYPGTAAITLSGGTEVVLPAHELGKIGAIGTVFGGGNEAKVEGSTNVNIGTKEKIDFESVVPGETEAAKDVEVKGVDIRGNVFGGGNRAEVTGKTNVVVGKKSE